MNIFSCNENLKSYIYPIVKILVSIVIVITIVNRNRLFIIENDLLKISIGVACFIVAIFCVYCTYISVSEIILVYDYRKTICLDMDSALKSSKEYSIDDIIFLLTNNDIIEIEAFYNDKIIEISAVSNSRPGSSNFFDKCYRLDTKEFDSIDKMRAEMISCFDNKKIRVVSVDGLIPSD